MGAKTRAQIVLQGCRQAGRLDLQTRATEALSDWLRQRAKDWPFLWTRQSREGLSLPAGTVSLKVGGGEGGITNEIQRILNPFWIYTAGFGTRSRALIQTLDNMDIHNESRVNDPASGRGIPTLFKVRTGMSASGVVCRTLIPFPVPDRSYLLAFDYIELETDPAPTGATIPKYPNDQTMIMFVEMTVTKWANGASDPDYQALKADVADAVSRDRIHDAQEPGSNDAQGLDPSIFK